VPPRFAYWTILIDNMPTAFRAREAQELVPTLTQLKRTNKDVVMKWFARGRLWESHEQEREDFQRRKRARMQSPGSARRDVGHGRDERRGKDWRPGGEHKDPRARFDREKRRRDKREQRDEQRDARHSRSDRPRPDRPRDSRPLGPKDERRGKPNAGRPIGRPTGDRPRSGQQPFRRPQGARPWSSKPPQRGANKPVTASQPAPRPVGTAREPEPQTEGTVKKPEPPEHS
jgi:hypothetical protein